MGLEKKGQKERKIEENGLFSEGESIHSPSGVLQAERKEMSELLQICLFFHDKRWVRFYFCFK